MLPESVLSDEPPVRNHADHDWAANADLRVAAAELAHELS
jgi:hypothetical protein